MPSVLALTGACLSAILVVGLPQVECLSNSSQSSAPDFSSPPPGNLTTLNNGSLFYQWRTKARFTFPSNNIGDPTALWQDDSGVFHVSGLKSNLRSANVSGSGSGIAVAFTKDFLTYIDGHNYSNSVAIGPGNKNDPLAVFDGSVIPKGYKGLPTLIYTGVHYLPISWSKPYIKGSEVQALAYSEDNGATWIKPNISAVIPEPPEGFDVTGFRDPWVFQAPQIASLLNDDPKTWYLSVSSGIRQVGPRLLLYRQNSSDFTTWQFLGPSVSTAVNTTFSPGNFSGNDGSNYETSNTLFLDAQGQNEKEGIAFVTMGAESGRETHSYHWSLWKMGQFVRNPKNESVIFQDHATGVLDWGIGYACTTVEDKKLHRRLGFCWNNEDFNSTISDTVKYRVVALGAYSIPREVYYKEISGVVADDLAAEPGYWSVATGNLTTTLAKNGVALAKSKGEATVTIGTLGCKPAREILNFRKHANRTWSENDFEIDVPAISHNNNNAELSHTNGVTRAFVPFSQSPLGRRWELQATIQIPELSLRNSKYEDFAAGFTLLRSSANMSADWPFDDAAMFYRPSNESFMITRNVALGSDNVNTDPEVGKLRLWNVSSNYAGAKAFAVQNLDIRAFMDGSFFEVYVNDVLTISTHIYYWYKDSTRMGFYLQFPTAPQNVSSVGTTVRYSNITVWEGVPNVFPMRPTQADLLIDTSVGYVEPADNPNLPLVYDGVGAPPLPPADALPYGIDPSTIG